MAIKIRHINQTASGESERKWRENSRETWAKKRDFSEKYGCFICTQQKDCFNWKKLTGVCPL